MLAGLVPLGRLLPVKLAARWPAWLWLVLALAGLTLWILIDRHVRFSYSAPEARLITETAIVVIGLGVLTLSLNRFLRAGMLIDGALALGFLALALPNIGQGLVLPASGADLFGWEDAAIYVWSVSRIMASLTLLVAIVHFKGSVVPAERRWQTLTAGALCTLLFSGVTYAAFYVFHVQVPDLVTESGRRILATGAEIPGAFSEVTAIEVALQLSLTALVALTCALFLAKRSEPPQDRFHRWIGISLIFAAFSQLHYAVYPSVYSPTITTGDMLRLAFYATLLVGICAEYLRYERSVRQLSALEERTGIARDIHDGVAQGLSVVLGSLNQVLQEKPASALRPQLATWRDILAEAQDNLRDAVSALGPASSGKDLGQRLAAFCRDFSSRYGMEIEFRCAGAAGSLPPPGDRELLFLLTEALHNVRKHAETSQAVVILEAQARTLVLRVSDNGVGLSLAGRDHGQGHDSTGYGFAGMTDRASRLGGSLLVTSKAKKGTTIELMIPRAVRT